MADEYKIGECNKCRDFTCLKNGKCIDCQKEIEIPDFLKEIFKDN